MNKKTLYRSVCTSLAVLLLIVACSAPQAPSLSEPASLLNDSDLANATLLPQLNVLMLEALEGAVVPDGRLSELPEASLSSAVVLPSVAGYASFTRNNQAVGAPVPWSVFKADQATDTVTRVYGGSLPLDSVATSADGNQTVFSALDASGFYQVYLHTVDHPLRRLSDMPSHNTNVSMSADGSVIVWEGNGAVGGARGTYILELASDDSFILNFLGSVNPQLYPSVSGNGNLIAFVRRLADVERVLVYDRASNSNTVVAAVQRSNSSLSHPSVSNDGKTVAWLQVTSGGTHRIRLKDMDSTDQLIVMSSNNEIRHPHLTSDGGYMIYGMSNANASWVITRNLETNETARAAQSASSAPNNAMFWQMGQLTVSVSGTVTRTSGPSSLESSSPGAVTSVKETEEAHVARTHAELLAQADRGTVRVIATFKQNFVPEGNLPAGAAEAQRNSIRNAQERVLAALAGQAISNVITFKTVPMIAMTVDKGALQTLIAHGDVLRVQEDEVSYKDLASSSPHIGATAAWGMGFTGQGWTVGIVDDGANRNHPFLADRIIEEGCFLTGQATARCPDGSTQQTGVGAAMPAVCGDCDHGTHVTGIAAGRGDSFSGVARDATIIATNVFGSAAGTTSSDMILALEYVYSFRDDYNIAAVNMSIGGGVNANHCDTDPRKPIIDNLRAVNIATVISSGNSGSSTGLGAPACISTAISVGSTNNVGTGVTDAVSGFSNSAAILNLLAPGSVINSSSFGTGFAGYSGTSMASPQVTGAWAIMRQKYPDATVAEVLTRLQTTGVPITDPRNNITRSRIQIDNALNNIVPPAAPEVTGITCASGTGTISGMAEPGATVNLYSGATLVGSTTADGSGNFSLAGVNPGTYSLRQAVDGTEGAAATVTVDCANITVRLYDTTGAVVASTLADDDGNYSFSSVLAGDYYVTAFVDRNGNGRGDADESAGAFGGAATPTLLEVVSGDYTANFSVGTPTEVEPNNTIATANRTFIGTAMTGTIGVSGDTDHFRFDVPAAGSYTMQTFGSCTGGNADTILTLFNAAGSQLANNDDATGIGLCSRIVFNFTTPGTYFVRVRAFSGTGAWSMAIW